MDNVERERNKSTGSIYTTWIIAIAMLAVGLVAGYIGRGTFGPEASAARATMTAGAAATQTMAVAELAAVETRAVANAEVMQVIISKTRHFKGQVDAPITLIEFSDFK